MKTGSDTRTTFIASHLQRLLDKMHTSRRIHSDAEVRLYKARRRCLRIHPIDPNLELLILAHQTSSSQMRRVDNALDSNVERPLEDSCESRPLHGVLPQNVDPNGATAEFPTLNHDVGSQSCFFEEG